MVLVLASLVRYKPAGMSVCAVLALCACSDGSLREKVGLERKPLDEFKVLSRPPLTVPPDFSLRPPSDDVSAINNSNISNEARTLLLGDAPKPVETPGQYTAPTTADSVFLRNAGADGVNPSVRDTIRAESGELEDESEKSTLDKLGEPLKKSDPLVNPTGEKKRILENKEQGKDITEGDTPTTKPKGESVLDRIF